MNDDDDSLPLDQIQLAAQKNKRVADDARAELFSEGRIRSDAVKLSDRNPHD